MDFVQDKKAHASARAAFPRGLAQPKGSFRFSMDALLAAAYLTSEACPRRGQALPAAAYSPFAETSRKPGAARARRRLLDLGTGCGVAAFAALLRHPELTATGVDIQPELLTAAEKNAAHLGLTDRFTALLADICLNDLSGGCSGERNAAGPACGQGKSPAERRAVDAPFVPGLSAIHPGSFDLVLANPPYRTKESGRLPVHALREQALFGSKDTLAGFCRAAAYALKHRGKAVFVFPAGRLAELTAAMQRFTLGPRRLKAVHPRADAPAKLILVMGQKNAASHLVLEPPLILYGPGVSGLSDAARAFCPFLARKAEPSEEC